MSDIINKNIFISSCKAIGIFLVFMHHYARSIWIEGGVAPPTLAQWVFPGGVSNYINDYGQLHGFDFGGALLIAFANFGYIGVHLFVFASGMGLAMGYSGNNKFSSFMEARIMKIVPPFWLSALFFYAIYMIAGSSMSAAALPHRMLLTTTFNEQAFFVLNSPLWFIALIIQLYVLFIPIRWFVQRFDGWALLLLFLASFGARFLVDSGVVFSGNKYAGHVMSLNWLFVFGAGIYFSDMRDCVWIKKYLRPSFTLGFGVIFIFIGLMASVTRWLYPAIDSFFGLGMVFLVVFFVGLIRSGGVAEKILLFSGGVSFFIYLYHRPVLSYLVDVWYAGLSESPGLIYGFALFFAFSALAYGLLLVLAGNYKFKKIIGLS